MNTAQCSIPTMTCTTECCQSDGLTSQCVDRCDSTIHSDFYQCACGGPS